MTVRVIVVDDQLMVRAGIAAIVDAEDDLEVVGEAADGAAGIELAQRVRPDVVLTTFHQDSYVFAALKAGASGFVLKDAEPADLLAAVRIVADGEAMLSPAVTRRLIDRFAAGSLGAKEPDTTGLDVLTPRERDVLLCIATGQSNAEIGGQLGISTGTVKVHVNALLAKLGVRDRVQATIAAYDLGLVRPNP